MHKSAFPNAFQTETENFLLLWEYNEKVNISNNLVRKIYIPPKLKNTKFKTERMCINRTPLF